MYAYFYGTIEEKEQNQVVIDVNNIGYNILMSEEKIQKLPPIGDMAKIFTYTSVREDAFSLYGFLTKQELKLFKLLITVSGIGPKGAMGILSVMDADTLIMAILSQDTKMLAKAPGVGAKSAGRIVLELKDKVKLDDYIENTVTNADEGNGEVISIRNEATEALTSLGFSVSDVYKVLQTIDITEETPVEDVIKQALKKIAR